jgi:hypothetical protein
VGGVNDVVSNPTWSQIPPHAAYSGDDDKGTSQALPTKQTSPPEDPLSGQRQGTQPSPKKGQKNIGDAGH